MSKGNLASQKGGQLIKRGERLFKTETDLQTEGFLEGVGLRMKPLPLQYKVFNKTVHPRMLKNLVIYFFPNGKLFH